MAYISFQPKDYFNTKLYTGNATTDHAQTGVGFQPDWLWIKERGGTGGHILVDAVRGVSASSTPFIKSNASGAEVSSNTNDFMYPLQLILQQVFQYQNTQEQVLMPQLDMD